MKAFYTGIKIIALIALAATHTIARTDKCGKVKGAIYDSQDAVILGTKVTVSNDGFQLTVYPDPQTGIFMFDVPPGTYSITTEQNWWFPIRRAKFLVAEGETVVINLQPNIRIASQALVVGKNGVEDVYERVPLMKLVELRPFLDSSLSVVIEYSKSKQHSTITTYSNAQLTYNDLSIRADVLRFNATNARVEASGNVTLDKGGLRQKKDRVVEQLIRVSEPLPATGYSPVNKIKRLVSDSPQRLLRGVALRRPTTFCDLHRFDDEGSIIETWNLMDSLAIMQQLGMLKG